MPLPHFGLRNDECDGALGVDADECVRSERFLLLRRGRDAGRRAIKAKHKRAA
jgi:hypothetical protein